MKTGKSSDLLERVAARAADSGAKHDAAILQSMREHVWKMLSAGGDPEEAAKIIALIIAARRQDLAERNASNDGNQEVEEWVRKNIEPELRHSPD